MLSLQIAGKEIVMTSDPEPDTNKVCTLKMGRTSGDRGRTMNKNCRQVGEVTSAK